ncbi:hypothetical protein NCI01_02275 [Nocardioides sp. STR3]|uniref:Uncharacterized protein n=2 Tax=Nocardioides pinisoli TaxID=2950279 RepID=A0ABT1KS93_9ACTN|nr:hypothetical protein [Nocardioides pinisoli]
MAASLSVANLGPDRTPPTPASSGDRLREGPGEQPTGRAGGSDPATTGRQVLVRSVGPAEGAAVFLVRATQRPARVRLEVAGPSGRSVVVRSVVVRSRDGQRLVLDGLDEGSYAWSATSPTAAPVVGEVRVAEAEAPVLAAAEEPRRDPPPPPASTPTPTYTPTPTPTYTPTPTPTPTPSPAPAPQPSPSPTHHPPQPSPTRQPSPTGQPTDPGTQVPGPVG